MGMVERLSLRLSRKGALLSFLLALLSAPSWGNEIPEYQLKAAYLYNFASFTEWPAEFDQFELCIFGEDPFGRYLRQISARKLNRRPIRLRTVRTVEGLEGCQMVFVAPAASNRISQVVKQVVNRPVLTVAETAGALEGGVMINMETRQGRVNFEVNLRAVKQHDLQISSKLLRLAGQVVR
jgi:hypothetical protein